MLRGIGLVGLLLWGRNFSGDFLSSTTDVRLSSLRSRGSGIGSGLIGGTERSIVGDFASLVILSPAALLRSRSFFRLAFMDGNKVTWWLVFL